MVSLGKKILWEDETLTPQFKSWGSSLVHIEHQLAAANANYYKISWLWIRQHRKGLKKAKLEAEDSLDSEKTVNVKKQLKR